MLDLIHLQTTGSAGVLFLTGLQNGMILYVTFF